MGGDGDGVGEVEGDPGGDRPTSRHQHAQVIVEILMQELPGWNGEEAQGSVLCEREPADCGNLLLPHPHSAMGESLPTSYPVYHLRPGHNTGWLHGCVVYISRISEARESPKTEVVTV